MREPLKNVKLRYLLKEYELEYVIWADADVDCIEVNYGKCAVWYASTASIFFVDKSLFLRKFKAYEVKEKQDGEETG